MRTEPLSPDSVPDFDRLLSDLTAGPFACKIELSSAPIV